MKDKNGLYAGIVWIISALALAVYGIMLLFNSQIPGIKEIVNFLSNIDDAYIYLTAFAIIFIEGLYFIGSFFPGASLVLILAIISGASGYVVFCATLFLIFLGWSIAGAVNIFLAKMYRHKIIKLQHSENFNIKDRVWTTWFPAFRSSYEVAQVIEGGRPLKIFISSLRVRFWATMFVGSLALLVPLVFNVHNLSNRESFVTIFIVFCISLFVGVRKIKNYFRSKKILCKT